MLALVSWTTSILEDYIWPECGLNSALRAQTPGSQPATLGGFFFFLSPSFLQFKLALGKSQNLSAFIYIFKIEDCHWIYASYLIYCETL